MYIFRWKEISHNLQVQVPLPYRLPRNGVSGKTAPPEEEEITSFQPHQAD